MRFSVKPKAQFITLFLLSTLTLASNFTAQANNLSLRAGQYKQNLVIGENQTDISPKGYDISASIDLTSNTIMYLDYSRYQKDSNFLTNNTLDYQKDSWGLGLSYYLGSWSFSAQYSDLDENLTITNTRQNIKAYIEDYQSPGYGISASYSFDVETANTTWYINIASGLQYSDWRLNLKRVERPIENESFTTGIDKGDTLFADVSLSIARFVSLSSENSSNDKLLYLGGSIGWNHLISGESSIVSRNGVSVKQFVNARTNSNRANQSSFSHSVQGEQYGLISLFMSYNLSDNISIDLDYSTSFSADKNSDGVYITLGYSW